METFPKQFTSATPETFRKKCLHRSIHQLLSGEVEFMPGRSDRTGQDRTRIIPWYRSQCAHDCALDRVREAALFLRFVDAHPALRHRGTMSADATLRREGRERGSNRNGNRVCVLTVCVDSSNLQPLRHEASHVRTSEKSTLTRQTS